MPHAPARDTPAHLTIDGSVASPGHVPDEKERTYAAHAEWLSQSRYIDYPLHIGLESRALCNASCDFCPYPSMRRKGERMPDELLAKVLDDIDDMPKDLPLEINLARMNEPFADKRVPGLALELEHRFPQVSLWFFTNASPLVGSVLDKLCDLRRVTQFVLSFNDHRKEVYEHVMGLRYDQTVANIDALHAMVEASQVCFTPLVTRVGDATDADREFLDWTRDRWPRFQHRVTNRYNWLGSVETPTVGPVPYTGCWQWFHMPILSSGKVAWCTLDHEGDRSWGHVADQHLLDIYNEPSRRALRMNLPMRRGVTVCTNCNHFG